jgi:GNAT superfamily N-acetyltransferase
MHIPTDPRFHAPGETYGPNMTDPSIDVGVARSPVMVPIRSLGSNHRHRIALHLQALDSHDRYLRFGYAATDAHIQRYVDTMDLERDDVFGIYNRNLALIAMAHLAYPPESSVLSCAEFGVSVLERARGRGYGARLFERAAMHARNSGITQMMIHALSENTPMLNIARTAGATVKQHGPDSEAYLTLPTATLDSRLAEIVHEQIAQVDYRMKQHAQSLRTLISTLQSPVVVDGDSGPQSGT